MWLQSLTVIARRLSFRSAFDWPVLAMRGAGRALRCNNKQPSKNVQEN